MIHFFSVKLVNLSVIFVPVPLCKQMRTWSSFLSILLYSKYLQSNFEVPGPLRSLSWGVSFTVLDQVRNSTEIKSLKILDFQVLNQRFEYFQRHNGDPTCLLLIQDANIRLRIVLRFICLHFTCRCGGAVTLGLDDLFCEPMDQFWHLEYLNNYKCCSDSGLSVLTSQECLDSPGVNSWSSWSTWSGCERLITLSGLENVRRRYRLSRSGQEQECLSVLLEAETCDEDKRRTGGCVNEEISRSLPRC